MCGRTVDRPARHICVSCLARLPFVPQVGCCSVCGRAVEGLANDYLCEDCSGAGRPHFDRAASALRFEGVARELVLGFKFRRRLWLRDDLVDWMESALRARFDASAVDVVLPMPATPWHRLDRGYNQCAYLARPLARRVDRRYDGGILVRTGLPRRQSSLTEQERRENAKGTFRVRHAERVRGRTVLVVDDVMTTGATLSECARALKLAGAWRVWGLTVVRSIRT